MEPVTLTYIAIMAAIALCIIVIISSIIIISTIRKIRSDLQNIWHNCQPFQMAQAYEFIGEKEKAVQCYKETLFNVVHRKFRIPKMSKKLQVDYLESKIISLGGKLPDQAMN
jgi:hypothetical protein